MNKETWISEACKCLCKINQLEQTAEWIDHFKEWAEVLWEDYHVTDPEYYTPEKAVNEDVSYD